MPIALPPPIARYFDFDSARDLDGLASCFTDDASVTDEGRTYNGCAAIIDWKRGAGSTYRYAVTPLAIDRDGDRMIVVGHLVGDFPGSPVDLRYAFRLAGPRIASLDIAP